MNNSKIVVLIILAVVGFFLIPLIAMPISSLLMPNPPLPEITYGEFPFRLEYEINGDAVVIEDTVICEFDGLEFSWGGEGKFRKWKSRLASGSQGNYLLLLTIDGINDLQCNVRDPAYYMGETSLGHYNDEKPPGVFLKNGPVLSQKEVLEKYGIHFISWEFTLPIENTFK
jgi:hypothetical protein